MSKPSGLAWERGGAYGSVLGACRFAPQPMGSGAGSEERLAELERRLARLERALGLAAGGSPSSSLEEEPSGSTPSPGAEFGAASRGRTPGMPASAGAGLDIPAGPVRDADGAVRRPVEDLSPLPRAAHLSRDLASHVLGISGVVAIVLAASYLVRLALDTGWLTPVRQVGLAALAGIGCVSGGLALRRSGRGYASWLSAGGVVVLFLTVYGAHLFYGLVGARLAIALVGALCLVALWLGQVFGTLGYAFLAMLGAYATPFLVPVEEASVGQLALYYSGWSVLFCGYSFLAAGLACASERAAVVPARAVYIVASLLALAGFDLIWRFTGGAEWQLAAGYQAGQLVLFSGTALAHSLREGSAMKRSVALAHGPSLALFYALEFLLFDQHVPELAPWLGLASVLVVLAVFLAARARLGPGLPAGELVAGYAALALFHSGYIELVPHASEPWVGVGAFLAIGAWMRAGGVPRSSNRPLLLAGGLTTLLGVLRLLVDHDTGGIHFLEALYVGYPLVLYAGYLLSHGGGGGAPTGIRGALLYGGHSTALLAVHRLVDGSVIVSVLWGALAIGALGIAMVRADRFLAQSSLLVFAVSGLKVLAFDLDGSAPLVRIGCLVALGISLYAGGWLYRRIAAPHPAEKEREDRIAP